MGNYTIYMELPDEESSLETIEPYSSEMFESLWCPICGCDTFQEIRFDGVYCDECSAEVKITPTAGDAGFVAHFMTDYGFNEEYDDRRPPDDYVYGKFMMSETTPYLAWWETRDLDSNWNAMDSEDEKGKQDDEENESVENNDRNEENQPMNGSFGLGQN